MKKYDVINSDQIIMSLYEHMESVMEDEGAGIEFLYGERKKSDNPNSAIYVNCITDSRDLEAHGINLVYIDIVNKHQENNLERLMSVKDEDDNIITWGNIDLRSLVFKALGFPEDNKDIVVGDYRFSYKKETKIPSLTDYSLIRIVLNVIINY